MKIAIQRTVSLVEQSALAGETASGPSVTVTEDTPYRSKAASQKIVSIEQQDTTVDATENAQQLLHLHVLVKMGI